MQKIARYLFTNSHPTVRIYMSMDLNGKRIVYVMCVRVCEERRKITHMLKSKHKQQDVWNETIYLFNGPEIR